MSWPAQVNGVARQIPSELGERQICSAATGPAGTGSSQASSLLPRCLREPASAGHDMMAADGQREVDRGTLVLTRGIRPEVGFFVHVR